MVLTYSGLTWSPIVGKRGETKGYVISESIAGDGSTSAMSGPNTAAKAKEVYTRLAHHHVRLISLIFVNYDDITVTVNTIDFQISGPSNTDPIMLDRALVQYSSAGLGAHIPLDIDIPYWEKDFIGSLWAGSTTIPISNTLTWRWYLHLEVLD